MTGDATDIYQAHLDVSTRLVFRGDAEAYCAHAQLPFVFRTARGVEVVETTADMVDDVRRIHLSLVALDTTDYYRIARSARFLDENTVEGFHVTYALRGAVFVVDPYESRMILRLADGVWKTCFAEHELTDPILSGRGGRALPGIFSQRWRGAGHDRTRDPAEALAIYRATVQRLADLALGEDFAPWHARYTCPYTVHYDEADDRIETPEQGRRYHEILHRAMAEAGADRITIHATSATFLSQNRLLGYHETSLTKNDECRFGPVRSRMVLVERDGAWLCNAVANALSTSAFARGAFEPSEKFPTMREIQKRMKT